MDWVRAINHAIEYMEEHLTDDITLADIAKSVNLSAFHFQRAFSLLTEMSPAEYLRKRRLSQAGAELTEGKNKVIDVALKYGYDSPESFSKAFTRFHGVSPMQVKNGSSIRFMNRYTVRIMIDGGCIMEYKIEQWEAVESYLGVCAQQKTDSDEFTYGIGCKASDVAVVPDGFEILHIPEHTWAVFKCVGPMPNAIQDMWGKIYREWLPVADYELIPDYDIENYLPGDPSSKNYVSEICFPIKRKA